MTINPVKSIAFAKWYTQKGVPAGFPWWESVLWLWREDECLRSDRSSEHILDAIVRLCGNMYDCAASFTPSEQEGVKRDADIAGRAERLLGAVLAEHDGGDCLYRLHPCGWVVCHSYDGDSLGRVLLSSEKD